MGLFCNKAVEEWPQVPDVNEAGIRSQNLGGKKKQYQFFPTYTQLLSEEYLKVNTKI